MPIGGFDGGRRITLGLLATFAALWSGSASAGHPMAVADVLAMERLDRVSVSPGGELIAAVVLRAATPGEVYGRTAYEVDPSRGDVWLIDRTTGDRRDLTNGRAEAAGFWCAIWSPDGQRLAMLSTSPERGEPRGGDNVRLYVWERKTARLRRLGDWPVMTQTRYGSAIHQLDIAGPGAATAGECTAGDERAPFAWLDARRLLAAALPPGQVSGLIDATARVYQQTSATREALRAGEAPVVSASGSGAERTGAGPNNDALLTVVDAVTGTRTDVARVPAYPFTGSLGIRISADARYAAALATIRTTPPRAGVALPRNDGEWLVDKRLGFVELAAHRAVRWVALPDAAQLPVQLEGWSADGRTVTFTARARQQDETAERFSAALVGNAVTPLARPPETVTAPPPNGLPSDATLIAHDRQGLVWSEMTPGGIFLRASTPGSPPRDLLALNRHLADVDLGRTLLIDYPGPDGKPLRGAVLLPPGYQNGTRLPVIAWVYGGYSVRPANDYFLDPYMPGIYNLRLYAAHGYAVLVPSMPLKFDGTQDHLTALAPLVLPAIDKLVSLGIADPNRIGIMGQSYGGFTALGLATQTSRFRAVVAMAPISDSTALYGGFDPTARGYPGIEHEDSANPVIAERGAFALTVPFYADPDRYRRNSPLSFVDRVTAPVLLIQGSDDRRGTSYQSEAFFMGLWRQGKTARIPRYWGESHSLAASPATVRDVVREVLAWFDRYLGENGASRAKSSSVDHVGS